MNWVLGLTCDFSFSLGWWLSETFFFFFHGRRKRWDQTGHKSTFKTLLTSPHPPSVGQIKAHDQSLGCVILQQRRREGFKTINQSTMFSLCSTCPHLMSPGVALSSSYFFHSFLRPVPFSSHTASQNGLFRVLLPSTLLLPAAHAACSCPSFLPAVVFPSCQSCLRNFSDQPFSNTVFLKW